MLDFMTRPVVLIAISAFGYAFGTVAMKSASIFPGYWAPLAIVCCMSAAILAEIVLLRTNHLGFTYIAILAAETILVLGAAHLMGDGFGLREAAGAVLVLVGAGLISV